MMEKIKPCPYCGSCDVRVAKYTEYGQHIYATCNECGARGPESASQSSDDTILLWNAAANALEAKEAEIEKLNDEIKRLNLAWQTSEFGCTNLRAERDEARRVARRLYQRTRNIPQSSRVDATQSDAG